MNFLHRYKKILLVIGFLFTIILMGYLIYATFFKQLLTNNQNNAGDTPISSSTNSLPIAGDGNNTGTKTEEAVKGVFPGTAMPSNADTIAKGGITKVKQINSAASIGTTLDKNGSDLKYYDKTEGKFYRLNKAGDKILLSDKVFHNVQNITWADIQNKAVLEYPDGANIVYDFDSEKQVTLPTHWKDFEFSPQGEQLVMKSIGLDENNRWLAISNSDGSQAKTIEAIGTKDSSVYPSWSPNNQIIAMYTEGIDFDRQEVFFVGLNGENFKSTVVEGRGFQPKWSPKGDRLLYSVYSSDNNLNPNLWIVNAQGEAIGSNRKNLNVVTWAEKCVFANTTSLYCAVPENLVEGSGLFPELAESTKDNLYKINTITGQKQLIAIPEGNYTISSIIVSEDEGSLYFTDKKNKGTYQVKLK